MKHQILTAKPTIKKLLIKKWKLDLKEIAGIKHRNLSMTTILSSRLQNSNHHNQHREIPITENNKRRYNTPENE